MDFEKKNEMALTLYPLGVSMPEIVINNKDYGLNYFAAQRVLIYIDHIRVASSKCHLYIEIAVNKPIIKYRVQFIIQRVSKKVEYALLFKANCLLRALNHIADVQTSKQILVGCRVRILII